MSKILEVEANISSYKKKRLKFSSYPALNAEEIACCDRELALLEKSHAEMLSNRCLPCCGTGRHRVWFFFSRRCVECCGDGHLVHVKATKANNPEALIED